MSLKTTAPKSPGIQGGSNPSPTVSNPIATPMVSADATPSFEVQKERFTAAFRAPIAFYGKVVDQNGEPVAQADVKCAANDKPLGGKPSEYLRKADVAGLFSIDGIVGLTLFVTVSKPGYKVIPQNDSREVTSSGLFQYGLEGYQSSKDAPVVFRLHKIGVLEPLVKTGKRNFRIARDGSPLSISTDQQGGHQVILRCWNKEQERPADQRQYDWRLEVTVPNGGLVNRKDAFEFEAPEDGYFSSDTLEMPASLPQNQWDSFAARSYFIRFEDGTFARAKLEIHAAGDHFVVWESYLNLKSGSRSLESQ